MTFSTVIGFALIAALLVISPGPNGILIAKTVPTSGKSAGFANIAGFIAAFYIHGLLSIFGISLILLQSANLFFILKMLGAAYLCWIGLKAIYEAYKGNKQSQTIKPSKQARNIRIAFFEGFLTNVLNPKSIMFYMAAFPQFISSGEDVVSSALILITVHSLLNAAWFSSMVLVINKLSILAREGSFQRWIKGTIGVVFLGFSAKLAMLKP